MLGKLIKNEWRSTWKIPAFINLFLVVFTLFAVFSMKSGILESDNVVISVLCGLMFMFYVIALCAISFVIVLYIAMRFYKNLYTDEGYLMHTLPVTQKGLIISKLLLAMLWSIVTGIVIMGSIAALMSGALSAADAGITVTEIFRELAELMHSSEFTKIFGMSFPFFIVMFFLIMLANLISGILMIYAAISLGQLFQKHKVLGSIVSYIGLYTILQIINSIATAPAILSDAVTDSVNAVSSSAFPALMWFTLGECIILCIVFFFLTEWLMKRKLNLD